MKFCPLPLGPETMQSFVCLSLKNHTESQQILKNSADFQCDGKSGSSTILQLELSRPTSGGDATADRLVLIFFWTVFSFTGNRHNPDCGNLILGKKIDAVLTLDFICT
jgi:hypothetical protein